MACLLLVNGEEVMTIVQCVVLNVTDESEPQLQRVSSFTAVCENNTVSVLYSIDIIQYMKTNSRPGWILRHIDYCASLISC